VWTKVGSVVFSSRTVVLYDPTDKETKEAKELHQIKTRKKIRFSQLFSPQGVQYS
jgi:hypothetical protein